MWRNRSRCECMRQRTQLYELSRRSTKRHEIINGPSGNRRSMLYEEIETWIAQIISVIARIIQSWNRLSAKNRQNLNSNQTSIVVRPFKKKLPNQIYLKIIASKRNAILPKYEMENEQAATIQSALHIKMLNARIDGLKMELNQLYESKEEIMNTAGAVRLTVVDAPQSSLVCRAVLTCFCASSWNCVRKIAIENWKIFVDTNWCVAKRCCSTSSKLCSSHTLFAAAYSTGLLWLPGTWTRTRPGKSQNENDKGATTPLTYDFASCIWTT